MKIIIWLWNIGEKYAKTRHNVGFLFVDFFAKNNNFDDWKDSQFSALISEKNINNEKIILVKPTTFMNLSWTAVTKIMNFYKIPIEHIFVISDDIDMEFSKIRIREKWSHGGQNGLRDIITKLGTDAFSRLKIGIGRHEKMAVADWVLSKFSQDELKNLEENIFPLAEEKIFEKFLKNENSL